MAIGIEDWGFEDFPIAIRKDLKIKNLRIYFYWD